MEKVATFIVALLILASCGICKRQPIIEYRDSVRVEYRDRIVHDTATFTITKEVEKIVTRDTTSHLENSYAKSDAIVSQGLLSHSLESIPQVIKVPFEVEVHDTTYVEKSAETVYATQYVEKELNWWQGFRIDAFWWLLLALIITNIKTILKILKLL